MSWHARSDLHLARKTWHVSMGLFAAYMYHYRLVRAEAVTILSVLTGLILVLEVSRMKSGAVNRFLISFFRPLLRKSEMKRISGGWYYILGLLLAVMIFPKSVAVMAILCLAIADPVSSIIGILFGKKGIQLLPGRSLVGTLAGATVCCVVGMSYSMAVMEAGIGTAVLVGLGGFFGGFAAEVAPLEVDDNLLIPVFTGSIFWIICQYFLQVSIP